MSDTNNYIRVTSVQHFTPEERAAEATIRSQFHTKKVTNKFVFFNDATKASCKQAALQASDISEAMDGSPVVSVVWKRCWCDLPVISEESDGTKKAWEKHHGV